MKIFFVWLGNIVKRFMFAINVLVVAAAVLGYASTQLNPERYWFLVYFGLIAFVCLCLNVGFVVYWLFQPLKRLRLLLSLSVLVLGFNLNQRLVQYHSPMAIDSTATNLKILTLNVGLFSYPSYDGFEQRKTDILNYCIDNAFDIVCFQEFQSQTKGSGDIVDDMFFRAKYNAGFFAKTRKHTDIFFSGIAIFSKYPIIKKDFKHFDKENNSVNGCAFADIVVQKDTFRVLVVHLQSIRFKPENYDYFDGFTKDQIKQSGFVKVIYKLKTGVIKRADQANLIAQWIRESPYKCIVAGDFNDNPMSYAYTTIAQNMNDTFVERGKWTGRTYRGSLPFLRIDNILVDKKFTVYSHKTDNQYFSDHTPVIAQIGLKP